MNIKIINKIPREIFLKIIDYLPINEQLKLKYLKNGLLKKLKITVLC